MAADIKHTTVRFSFMSCFGGFSTSTISIEEVVERLQPVTDSHIALSVPQNPIEGNRCHYVNNVSGLVDVMVNDSTGS